MSRSVIVDDNDSGIKYVGGWTSTSGSNWDKQGNFGATYLNTLHSTTTGGSFSYMYEGSSGSIIGTIHIKDSGGVIDPTWDCTVDGSTIPLGKPFQYTENNWVLCGWDENRVPPGKHTVTVNVKSSGQAFLFDQFRYVPSTTVDGTIFMDFRDSKIQYGDGWAMLGTVARMAPNGGAVMTIPFYGTGLNWYSIIPIEMGKAATTAEYSIDGGSTTTITVPGPYGGVTQYNQLVFSVHGLSRAQHTLRVTSKGTSGQTPLVLAYAVVEGGSTQEQLNAPAPPPDNTDPTPSLVLTDGSGKTITTGFVTSMTTTLPMTTTTMSGGSGNNNGTSNNNNNPNSGGGNDKNSGNGGSGNQNQNGSGTNVKTGPSVYAIVLGVVGGIILIVLIVAFLAWLLRRQKRRGRATPNESDMVQPFDLHGPGPISIRGAYTDSESAPTPNPFNEKSAVAAATQRYPNPNAHLYGGEASSHQGYGAATQYGGASNLGSQYSVAPPSEAGFSTASSGSSAPLQPLRHPTSPGLSSKLTSDAQSHSSSGASNRPFPSSSEVVIDHEDSGVRIPQTTIQAQPPPRVVEFPPSYTPA